MKMRDEFRQVELFGKLYEWLFVDEQWKLFRHDLNHLKQKLEN